MDKIYIDELQHFGVKGMKWGVRHDKERSNHGSSSKPQSDYQKRLSKQYQEQHGISKEEADKYAAEHAKMMKKVLIGAGIAAGLMVGGYAYSKYKREVADDIIRAGKTISTVKMNPDRIINGEKFYTSHKKWDQIKYAGMFGQETVFGFRTGGYKKQITAKTTKDIKIAGVKTSEKLYNQLRATNPSFAKDTMFYKGYKDFGTMGLLGAQDSASKTFIDALRKQGYGGVADINDRKFSGYKTRASIIFDNAPIGDIKVKQLTKNDVTKNLLKSAGIQMVEDKNGLVLGGSLLATGVASASGYTDKKIRENKKKKKS